jgi:hypothetical protein
VVVNLDRVSFVFFTGSKVELHFVDGGSHMRRFGSIEEMVEGIKDWQQQTSKLREPGSKPAHLTDYPN